MTNALLLESKPQKLEASIDIYSDDNVLTLYNGTKECRKLVTTEQLSSLFKEESIFFPEPNTVWVKSGPTIQQYLMKLPKSKTPETILTKIGTKTKAREIRMPAMLAMATIDNGYLTSLALWCYSGKLTDDTMLYLPPLPNHTGGGGMCLGNTRIPMRRSASECVRALLYESEHTQHSKVGKAEVSFQQYLRQNGGNVKLQELTQYGYADNILNGER